MTPTQEKLLDLGILPENVDLSPEQQARWFRGLHNEADKRDQKAKEAFTALLTTAGRKYVRDARTTEAEQELAAVRLLDWMEDLGSLRAGLFYSAPDFSRFLELFCEPILAYNSQNQSPSGHWGTAEYALVAKSMLDHGTLNFQFIDGPYNVELGAGGASVDLETGARRRTWAWRLQHSLPDLAPYRGWPLKTGYQVSFTDNLNLKIFQDFLAGHFIK